MLILEEIRCPGVLPDGMKCNRRLGDINGQARIKCPKCKSMVIVDTTERKVYIKPERRN